MEPTKHSVAFSFKDVVKAIGMPNGYLIGACATAPAIAGVNAECIPCEDCGSGKRTSYMAKVGA